MQLKDCLDEALGCKEGAVLTGKPGTQQRLQGCGAEVGGILQPVRALWLLVLSLLPAPVRLACGLCRCSMLLACQANATITLAGTPRDPTKVGDLIPGRLSRCSL